MKYFSPLLAFILWVQTSQVAAQCTPSANDNCANAQMLVVDNAPTAGNTCGTIETGELKDCAGASATNSVWYAFVATSPTLFVAVSSTAGCYVSSAIWDALDGCPIGSGCHALSCQSAIGGPANRVHRLDNLTVGATYRIQILYAQTGACGTSLNFTVGVSSTQPAGTLTNSAAILNCGTTTRNACVFTTAPTSANQIFNACGTISPQPTSANSANEVYKGCFNFVAPSSGVITGYGLAVSYPAFSCSGGLWNWVYSELNDANCNMLTCGNVGSVPLICNQQYKLCITFEIPSGCTYNDMRPYVVVGPKPMKTWVGSDTTASSAAICQGDTVPLNASGLGFSRYFWTPSNSLSADSGAVVKAFPTTTTTYTVYGYDVAGCYQTKTVQVTVNPKPTPGITPNNPTLSCANPTATLTASGGSTYLWSTGATGASITTSTPGTYTVTVTTASGCTATVSTNVLNGGTLPTATVSPTSGTLTCSTTSITLTATGGGTYLWSNGATSNTINVTTANTYSVTVTDNNGCSVSTSVAINQNITPPVASVTPSTFTLDCINTSASLTASGGGTYLWSTGVTTNLISVSQAGTYTVTVTDTSNNCTANASATVSTLPVMVTSFTPTGVLCNGGSTGAIDMQVLGGQGPFTFQWSNQSTSEDISSLTAGTYTVTVRDNTGCTVTGSATVSEPPVLTAPETHTDVACNGGANATISISPTGGTGAYTYVWNDGATTSNRNNLSIGTFTVTVTDANQCTATNSVTIVQGSAIEIFNTYTDVSCYQGRDGSIDMSPRGGNQPYTYKWNDAATSEDRNQVPAGTYSITVTDMNQCTSTASVTLSEPTALTFAQVVNQPTCPENNGDGDVEITPSGATPPYTYSWSNGNNTPDNTQLSPGVYSVTVTDANSCSVTISFSLAYMYQFSVNASPPVASIQPGEAVTLNYQTSGSSGTIASQKWTPVESLTCDDCRSPVAAPTESTTYQVEVTNDAGCIARDVVVINVTPGFSLYVPNTFTPNSDGFNDYFEIYGTREGIAYLEVQVFNRWGELVYESNDHYFKWDGSYKGDPLPTQALVWKLKLGFINGKVEDLRKGSVTLLK